MVEITLFGRGGQGGVTLAKLIATAYFNRGENAQAFGVYAAERSGAPVQAYVRIDPDEITNHNQIREPDHVIVLDPTLVGPAIVAGLKRGGWIILNTALPVPELRERFSGYRIAAVDATAIAVDHGLGTRAVPIINTTLFGAFGRVFGLTPEHLRQTLKELRFEGANVDAANEAFTLVQMDIDATGEVAPVAARISEPSVGLLDSSIGTPPRIRTGSWATRKPESRRLTPPCNHRCPAGNDVRGFVEALSSGDTFGALEVLLETTPLPGICGRVCPAPCMDACNREQFDQGVNVRDLERFAADTNEWPAPHRAGLLRNERVAVVGSGPAGLSGAYQLARLGYHVSLFEAGDELGGVLRNGIPPYRLPREVLDREIGYVLLHGVTAYTDAKIDRAAMRDLTTRYDAVFVATGLQHVRSLQLGHDDIVTQGIEFLDRVHRGEDSLVRGDRVVVVGGGNTAIDAARTALRLGAGSVRIVYRRTLEQMPAIADEIRAAIEEGVVLYELAAPVRVARIGHGAQLVCQRLKLGDRDASGRFEPVPEDAPDSQLALECDRVILALGQSADLSVLMPDSEAAGRAPVFIAGDFANNEGTVAAAIGSGRRAALHIHKLLASEDLLPAQENVIATPEVINVRAFAHANQRTGEVVPAQQRVKSFVEVHRGLANADAATAEAARCFSCGVCNACDRCLTYCPEGVLTRSGDALDFHYDYCKGCGLCAAECPRGAIAMAEL